MKRLVLALVAATPILLSAPAHAEPLPLTNPQMDQVSAGFFEIDASNTSYTVISIIHRPLDAIRDNSVTCSNCFLKIISNNFTVVSRFGP